MIDTHAHLDRSTASEQLGRARAAGVGRVIAVGTTIASCRVALELSEQHDGVFACVGIHPHEADGPDALRLDELRDLLGQRGAVAVGETGLDHFRDYAPHEAQRRLFEAHLAIARELGRPVVVHTRAADDDTAAMLSGHEGTVVLHCFSSPALLPVALERGYYVSFAGNVTYPKAGELRDAARLVPKERLLVETDAPYLSPQPVRGQMNEPANIVHTLEALAAARGEEPEELAHQIDVNAALAFGLS